MTALITLRGMYDYDSSIFSDFSFVSNSNLTRTTAIRWIIQEAEELPLLWLDPNIMREKIRLWCATRKDQWYRMEQALSEIYNPVHNYDRYEDITDDLSNTHKDDITNTNSVNAYNTGTMTDKDKATAKSTITDTGKNTRKGHMYGNIGVTTAAQMITGELDVRQNDVYRIIANEFIREFCVRIY